MKWAMSLHAILLKSSHGVLCPLAVFWSMSDAPCPQGYHSTLCAMWVLSNRYALWGTLMQSLEQSLGISSEDRVLDLLLHLPLSRELELEADEIAVVLMSKVMSCLDQFL